jgi:hypothetical protein
MTYEETLNSFGWTFSSSCPCGGTLKKKYKNPDHPGYVVIAMPQRLKANLQVTINNQVKTNSTLSDLENVLKNL